MYCAKCGHEIREGAAFCAECGAPVSPRSNVQAPQEASATSQAQPAPEVPQAQPAPEVPQAQPVPSAPQVQATPSAPQSEQGQAPQPAAQKKRRGLIIGIVAGVVAVAAIVAVVAFVVLPGIAPRGMWMATKITTVREDSSADTSTTSIMTKNINKNGVLESETYKDSGDNYGYTSDSSYTYNDQGFCESSDTKSEISSASSDGVKESSKYDWKFGNNGMPSELTIIDEDDEEDIRYAYEYDDKGNISKRSITYVDNSYTVSTEFNEQGFIKHVDVENDGKAYETTFEYERDGSGRITSSTFLTLEKATGKKASEGTETFEYDENGNIKSSATKETTYDLDKNGERTEIKTTSTYEYTYVDNPSSWAAKLAHIYGIAEPKTC